MITFYDFLLRLIGPRYDSAVDSRTFYYRTRDFPALKKIDQLYLDTYHAMYATREVDNHKLAMDQDLMKRHRVASVSLRRDGVNKRGVIIDLGKRL